MATPETIQFPLLMWIVLLPLIGAAINTTIAFFLHKDFDIIHDSGGALLRKFTSGIALGAVSLSFLIAVFSVIQVALNGISLHGHTTYPELVHHWFTWFEAGPLEVNVAFMLDPLSSVMVLVITGVGALIHLYSIGYMSHDRSFVRYFAYLNFFIFAMLILVLGDSLPLLFFGWEGVGLASYLLIGFWFEDEAKAVAGKKAFITNRIGDFAFVLGMFLLFNLVGDLSFVEIRAWVASLSPDHLNMPVAMIDAGFPKMQLNGMITMITLLFFAGATGKSAQIPLYVWLPDAMAGPTPVSALIHAATMVTAGIYLLVRMNYLFALAPLTMTIIATIGGLTAFFAATIGIVQNDIKKVLAYSTVSQLGYMFLAVGVGGFFAGIFHLMTHAFFKALLFLGSGSVIHGMSGEQDIQKMGGLKKHMPITAATFLIGCLAIAGVPLFSGFFSKDEILWFTMSNQHLFGGNAFLNWALWGLAVVTAAMTAFYMFRLYFLTFTGESRVSEEAKHHLHESPKSMTIPLVVLAVLAFAGGFIGIPEILPGPNILHDWLHSVIAPGEGLFTTTASHGMAWIGMGIATTAGLGGIILAGAMYGAKGEKFWENLPAFGKMAEFPAKFVEKNAKLHTILFEKYYIDELYQATLGRGITFLGIISHRIVDELIIDTVMVNGVAHSAKFTGIVLRQFQNGNVQRYAVYIIVGFAAIWLLL